MKISIIGGGKVGSGLAARLTAIGHEVAVANTSTPVAETATRVKGADLIVLAVPFSAVPDLAHEVKAATVGKILIDATNPLSADFMSLTVGHTTSGGEQVAQEFPGAVVVKAFNTVFAANLASPVLGGARQFLPVAGDDDAAKKIVIELGETLGFAAQDAGPLANARYLEPVVELLVQLAYGKGLGEGIGLALARA
ncbi:NADPH-dependent F420 reductase [Nonomuraea sp. NPDC050227]|uniref:NADPH-dependent F420 reductase n=1 Tax=Nonomuraea sp. NPDC050227 TaxID=3364360 RepID=UPI0037A9038B